MWPLDCVTQVLRVFKKQSKPRREFISQEQEDYGEKGKHLEINRWVSEK